MAAADREAHQDLVPPAIGWALFALLVALLLGYAARVDRQSPRAQLSGEIAPDGSRFGLSLARRRAAFVELMRGEKENREQAEKMSEKQIWNRNHDSYFHQYEWGRVLWWSRHLGLQDWQGWLIVDEGIRGHWPMPPGVPLLADEAPLLPVTRPLDRRPVITPAGAPAAPAATPAGTPVGPAAVGAAR